MWSCPALLLLTLAATASCWPFSTAAAGVPPSRPSSLSRPPGDFICPDGSRLLGMFVNDDYCDCGEDEPATGACPNAKFMCDNVGHIAKEIPSSLVGDGLCDCCDGSDEWQRAGVCSNVCAEEAAVYAAAAAEAGRVAAAGRDQRARYSAEGKAFLASIDTQIETAAAEVTSATASVSSCEALVAVEDAAEAQDALAAAAAARLALATSLRLNELSAQDLMVIIGEVVVAHEEAGGEAALVTALALHSPEVGPSIEDTEVIVLAMEAKSAVQLFTLPLAVEARARFSAASSQGSEGSVEGNGQTTVLDPADPLLSTSLAEELARAERLETEARANLSSVKALEMANILKLSQLPDGSAGLLKFLIEVVGRLPEGTSTLIDTAIAFWARSGVSLGPTEDLASPTGKYVRPEAEKARSDLAAAKAALSTAQRSLDDLKKSRSADYGSDAAFFSLKDKCFKLEQGQYTYELCPFDRANQDSTSLGRWGKWEPDSSYTKQVYENGQHCHGGIIRSTTVQYSCGSEHALTQVSEPSTCKYVMEFNTPAVC